MKLAVENRQGLGSVGHDAVQRKALFHRLNNQLAVALACAESLEFKTENEAARALASQMVAKVLDAAHTVIELQQQSTAVVA